jgi:hypothetical protein
VNRSRSFRQRPSDFFPYRAGRRPGRGVGRASRPGRRRLQGKMPRSGSRLIVLSIKRWAIRFLPPDHVGFFHCETFGCCRSCGRTRTQADHPLNRDRWP